MGLFKSVEEMFNYRAKACKKKGDQLWAKAKQGEGGHNFASARKKKK